MKDQLAFMLIAAGIECNVRQNSIWGSDPMRSWCILFWVSGEMSLRVCGEEDSPDRNLRSKDPMEIFHHLLRCVS